MKKFSAPSTIGLLDVVFVSLFALSQEQSPNIKIKLPGDTWNNNVLVVSLDKNKKMKHWYNFANNGWQDTTSIPKGDRRVNFAIGNIDCSSNKICSQVPTLDGEKKEIYIIGDLYDEVSGMIADSCLKYPKQCSNVTYQIKDDWSGVDRQKLKKDHRIFRFTLQESKDSV